MTNRKGCLAPLNLEWDGLRFANSIRGVVGYALRRFVILRVKIDINSRMRILIDFSLPDFHLDSPSYKMYSSSVDHP